MSIANNVATSANVTGIGSIQLLAIERQGMFGFCVVTATTRSICTLVKMDKGTFLYSEQRFSDWLRLPRKMVSDARDRLLTKDQDWKNKGGEIALTHKGALRILQAFEIPEVEFEPTECYLQTPMEKNGEPLLLCAPGRPPEPIKMRVVRIFPNPMLLEAQEVGRNQLYRVIVKSNLNFTVRMEFNAVPDPANPGFWRLPDERLPRSRGRW